MSFPMRITLKRIVESKCPSRVELLERLEFWAQRYGFQRSADEGNGSVYARGNHWQAFYTFDIRKVPTEVRITFLADDVGTCICTLVCGSWLQYSTSGDERRLSEQIDLLEACLKGALTDQATPATKHNPDADSHAIRPSTDRGI